MDSQGRAVKCAENWRRQGFNFDPNSMTSSQMFERVQDIRQAAYWAQQGYCFDPNLMTSREMDEKVRDFRRAEYWNRAGGYTFDPNTMTAEEMDEKAKEFETAAYWERQGYYYDPNSQQVFLDKTMRTELGSLAGMHASSQGGNYFLTTVSREGISQGIPESAPRPCEASSESGIYPNTGSGHWVKKRIDRGRFVLLEDRSLWRINPVDRIDSSLWLPLEDIAVVDNGNPRYPYRLVNADASDVVEARLIAKGSTHWISDNIESGRFLKLQDDSLWEVNSSNGVNSRSWPSLSAVVVAESQDPSYPYLLINTDEGEVVEAKVLGGK
jgi:hypothetical protein